MSEYKISLRIDPEVYKEIKKYAENRNMSAAEYIRTMATLEIEADKYEQEVDKLSKEYNPGPEEEGISDKEYYTRKGQISGQNYTLEEIICGIIGKIL